DDLHSGVESTAKDESLTTARERELRVGANRFNEPRVLRADLCAQLLLAAFDLHRRRRGRARSLAPLTSAPQAPLVIRSGSRAPPDAVNAVGLLRCGDTTSFRGRRRSAPATLSL